MDRLPTVDSRTKRLIASLLICGLCVVALASAPAFAQSTTRIAVVDIDRVVLSSKDFQAMQARLKAMDEALGPKLQEKVQAISALRDSLAGKTPDQQRPIQKQIEDETLAGRRLREDAEREAEKMQQQELEKIQEKLGPIIQAVQAEANYDLILNANPGIVLAVGQGLDITQTVIDKLNAGG